MPYTICINKVSPCTILPFSAGGAGGGGCARSIEVYGCTPDLTVGEKGDCVQGTTTPAGCCCAWTVPSGVTRVQIEIWGPGGGGGSGSTPECCGTNPPAGAGTYMSSALTVTPGDILTLCAGAGGCFGTPSESSGGCCCGQRGSCSFVLRNGTFCIDSQGGDYGISGCYYNCGCTRPTCGSIQTTGACGTNSGCYSYNSGVSLNAGSTNSYTSGCMSQQSQMSLSGGATQGGEGRWWGYNCNCWTYLRWNNACTNTAGIIGPGGDCGPTGQAYVTPGSTQYACATTDQSYCARYHASPPGYFPGGGGGGGYSTTCCNSKTAGGGGGAGYIRVIY